MKFRLRLARYGRRSPALHHMRIKVTFRDGGPRKSHLVALHRRADRLELSCPASMIRHDADGNVERLRTMLPLIAGVRLDVLDAVADISDGEESGPGILSFCSRDPEAILIPDAFFVGSRGYEQIRQLAALNMTPWSARSGTIVWRGTTTGVGCVTKPTMSADDPDLVPRVRLCLALKGTPDTDCKLSSLAQSADPIADHERLARADMLGQYVRPVTWCGLKFAIDIDGNTNAWSNLFCRLIMGCCVLKVASPLGYRQWYYDALTPWLHYVPVRADLSDLHATISWCRANLDECERIATRGQAFAMARTCDGEMAAAIDRIRKAHDAGRMRANLDADLRAQR